MTQWSMVPDKEWRMVPGWDHEMWASAAGEGSLYCYVALLGTTVLTESSTPSVGSRGRSQNLLSSTKALDPVSSSTISKSSSADKKEKTAYRKVTITFSISQEEFDLLEEGHLGLHINFLDSSINTVREPWECPHCENKNSPESMYCNDCTLFVEYCERVLG